MNQHQYPPTFQSWTIWCLGVAFYFSGFFHRMVTAVMADQLMADFGIGAAALGNFSSSYYYSYVAVQIPTGILADYWGPRKLLTTGTLLSSIGAFLFAVFSSIHMANFGRLIIGASIGVAWVSILKLSTRWFQPNRFAVVTGLALALGIFGALSAGGSSEAFNGVVWIPILFSQNLPLWLIIFLYGAVGFAASAIAVGFAFIKESVPVVFAGTVTGVCNMGMEMGPMILQPDIGWILDLKWNGAWENGIRIYDLNAYHVAFGAMIGLSLLGALIIPFARETFCRQLEE